ncbi:MAG: hypothetical protein ACRENF_08175 [Thermodesulfobacteriota bacterium]
MTSVGYKTLFITGLISFAFGRYSMPTKTHEEKTESVKESIQARRDESREEDKSREKETQVIVTEHVSPSGAVTKRTKTVTKDLTRARVSDQKTEVLASASESQKREIRESETNPRSLSLGVLAGKTNPFLTSTPRLGFYIHRPFLGPFDLGLMITNEFSFGVLFGLTY